MKPRIPPALVLLIIAPVFGEVVSGSTRINDFFNPVTFITELMLYGCGAVIVRELVFRWKKGWPAILLLGMAYGIFEEGLLVQSFFDPTWKDLGVLAVYGRVAGVNWVWAEHLTIFHALISISASIAFVQILFPDRHEDSWVKSRLWWALTWAAFIGVLLLWKILTIYDSGIWQIIAWVAILLLAFLARTIPSRILQAANQPAPRPRRFFWAAFIGWFVQFIIIYGNANKTPFIVPMLELLAFDTLVLFIILRWNGNGAAWDDRHRLALISGALSFFLVFTLIGASKQYPIMLFSNPILLFLLWWTYHKANSDRASRPNTVVEITSP
jgi:hypothetical protein